MVGALRTEVGGAALLAGAPFFPADALFRATAFRAAAFCAPARALELFRAGLARLVACVAFFVFRALPLALFRDAQGDCQAGPRRYVDRIAQSAGRGGGDGAADLVVDADLLAGLAHHPGPVAPGHAGLGESGLGAHEVERPATLADAAPERGHSQRGPDRQQRRLVPDAQAPSVPFRHQGETTTSSMVSARPPSRCRNSPPPSRSAPAS